VHYALASFPQAFSYQGMKTLKPAVVTTARPSVDPSLEPLRNRRQVLKELHGIISSKKFGELVAAGKIPEITLGFRTRLYKLSSVYQALSALEKELE
jgi:hypothetical protein